MAIVTDPTNNTVVTRDTDSVWSASDRPLAYVELISDIAPIANANTIEVATVRGWKVVVKKNLYKPGDFVIYAEIDSILPPWKYFVDDKLDKVGFRITTLKMRGQISQGYCIPFKALEDHPLRAEFDIVPRASTHKQTLGRDVSLIKFRNSGHELALEIGTDLTEFLGIKKSEIIDKVDLPGIKASSGLAFPIFLRKSDQTRIQNLPEYPAQHAEMLWELTEKLDGSSFTAFQRNGDVGICSRNMRIPVEDNQGVAVKVIVEQYGVLEKLLKSKRNIAIQGELIGPGIQGNIYKLSVHRWAIYDVFDIELCRFLMPQEREAVLNDLCLSQYSVPVLGTRTIKGLSVADILSLAEGTSVLAKGVNREGIVFKACTLADGQVLSFKAVSNTYLLKHTGK